MAIPYVHLHLDNTSSTQDDVRDLLEHHERAVVSTPQQNAGRGRRGRHWETAPRALAVSVGWRPAWPREVWSRIALVAGLAARDTFESQARVARDGSVLASRPMMLKWPNDLVIAGDKVGGILSESDGDRVVVGLGVNLYWPSSPAGITSVFDTDPGASIVETLATAFAEALFLRTSRSAEDWGRDEYQAASATVGRRVRWEPSGVGRAVDVGLDGELVVETSDGSITISAGEVWHVRSIDD